MAAQRRLDTEQMDDALARAALSAPERRVVERLLTHLCDELGDDLHAVWLYGSRARGEVPHPESDVDLMVIVDASRGWSPYGTEILPTIEEIAGEEGVSPVWISAFVRDPEWLRGRREIESFFIQEVDRDKLILHGSGLE